jgi:hypothetical protein
MFTEPDDMICRLQHEKGVWRGIAIGLAGTLVLLLALAGVFGLMILRGTKVQAMRAEEARMEALHARDQAEQARMEAQRAVERRKAKQP